MKKEIIQAMKIKIESYSNSWPHLFEELKYKIRCKLKKYDITIEHIGSTSVKNLASKPIIDILIGVSSEELDNYIEPIIDLGFTYIKKYEKDNPNRRFFFLIENKKRIAHIHLVNINSRWFKRHMAFRNELRSNKIIREKYENLKYKLVKKEWKDGNDYADAKTEFIRAIEKNLGFN